MDPCLTWISVLSAIPIWELYSQRSSELSCLSVLPSSLVTEWVGDITGVSVVSQFLLSSVCRGPCANTLKR